ncbi:hypothetical protein NVS55_09950 [Myxococcus stipitatus]|uniref:hypothetical protein n=1 Tax=Myxococcus stipitatus TaxID=83455 RepID=UPI003144D692
MPIEVRYTEVKPGETAKFDFNGKSVSDYVVGIAYWKYDYGNDRMVHQLELSVQATKPNDTTISASVTGKLADDSGNVLDTNASKVVVCCVAVIGPKNPAVALENVDNIPDHGESKLIALPNPPCAITNTFLSGWQLSYSKQHQVAAVEFETGSSIHGNEVGITAIASMHDNSGNLPSTAQVNGGLIAATTTGEGLLVQLVPDIQKAVGEVFALRFSQPLSSAVVLLQKYKVTFHKSQDNYVRTIGGGCEKWEVDEYTVRLTEPRAFVTDDSNNVQTNDQSRVSLVIIGIPKA